MIVIKRLERVPDDTLLAINRLLEMLTGKQCKKPLSRSDVLECLLGENSFTFIAEDDQKEGPERFVGIGFIFFKKTYSHWLAEIHDVVVDETYQGQGIGTKLVEALIEKAQEFAALKKTSIQLSLTSRPGRKTHDFYCKLGFGKNETNLYRMTIAP